MIKSVVKWFTISALVIIIVADIIFVSLGYTISEYYRDLVWVDNLWTLPFITSIILGHWGINLFTKIPFGWWRYVVLLGIVALALVVDLTIPIHLPWYLTIPGGLITGALLWPQRKVEKELT